MSGKSASVDLTARWTAWNRSSGSGPFVARLYHRALAVCLAIAFLSLAVQVEALLGERGLLPMGAFVDSVRAAGKLRLGAWQFPSLFWWITPTDRVLVGLAYLGVALGVLGAVTRWSRLVFVIALPLYLSYATLGQAFFSFQWDNLLLESLLLAVWLPRERRARWIHVLFRVLLFKLYFESGIAKWQSHLRDWQDGSAMQFYYETAPIPAPLGYWLHKLPSVFHLVQSWTVLALELVVPFAIFGPRRARQVALIGLTAFQLINFASANYGFFIPLTLALHVFLLDDTAIDTVPAPPKWEPWLAGCVASFYLLFSFGEAWTQFVGTRAPSTIEEIVGNFRVINTYHLFGSITRERIEPEVEVQTTDSDEWQAAPLKYKMGAIDRPLPWIAPHQPRVAFQMWFFGLRMGREPEWAIALLQATCDPSPAISALFEAPLPAHIRSARYAAYRYTFTDAATRRTTGAIWQRERIGELVARECPEL